MRPVTQTADVAVNRASMIDRGLEGSVAQGSSNKIVPMTIADTPPNTTIFPGVMRWNWRNHGGEYGATEDGMEE
jgi:hypothetical protein